jgi:hypothetical protein
MIHNYIAPALWGALLLISFIGYGCLLRRALFRSEQLGWANEAAWGMAFVVLFGGVLTFTNVVSSNLIISLLLIGALLMGLDKLPLAPQILKSLFTQLKDISIANIARLSLYFVVFALAAIQYLHSVNLAPKAVNDDLKAYFAFPKQMLELGSFNVDPFDLMRLGNGLGGQSMLHSLMLAYSDFNNLMLVDGGVALLICVGLVLRICSQRKLNAAWSIAILLFFLSLPFDQMRINSSSLATGRVMLLALFAFLDRKDLNDVTPIRNAFIVGLLSSSACALKSNLIPPLVFTLGFSYLWHLYATRFNKQALQESILVPAFVLLLLLPWMLTLKHTSGTMLWPIFGSGFAESNYGSYVSGAFSGGLSLEKKWDIIFHGFILKSLSLLLVVTGAIVYIMVKMRRRAMTHAYILGAILGTLSILLSFDLTNNYPFVHYSVDPFVRYTFVCISIALLIALTELASYTTDQYGGWRKPAFSLTEYWGLLTTGWRYKFGFFAVVASLMHFFWYFNYGSVAWKSYQEWFADPRVQTEKAVIIPEVEYSRHRNAQASVPVGEAILSSDLYTLLYDYSRNKIFNANVPGGASPPPGMPYFQGPEAVATYLLSQGIRYVSYHYEDQAGYPVSANLWRLSPTRPYTHRALLRYKFALDRVLGELGYSRSRIYDDGALFIIDLKTPLKVHEPYPHPNYFQQGKILSLAWAKTYGFDTRKIWTYGHAEISDIDYNLEQGDNLLVLNTFGYHPWKNELSKLNLTLAVNGKMLPMKWRSPNSYYFSLESITEPIKTIVINSNTFDPRREQQFSLGDYFKDEQMLGIDVDTIQIRGDI